MIISDVRKNKESPFAAVSIYFPWDTHGRQAEQIFLYNTGIDSTRQKPFPKRRIIFLVGGSLLLYAAGAYIHSQNEVNVNTSIPTYTPVIPSRTPTPQKETVRPTSILPTRALIPDFRKLVS